MNEKIVSRESSPNTFPTQFSSFCTERTHICFGIATFSIWLGCCLFSISQASDHTTPPPPSCRLPTANNIHFVHAKRNDNIDNWYFDKKMGKRHEKMSQQWIYFLGVFQLYFKHHEMKIHILSMNENRHYNERCRPLLYAVLYLKFKYLNFFFVR